MSSFHELLQSITPEIYQSLKTAVEIGKWADGRKLSVEQKELCLQAMIAWEKDHLPEDQHTGYMEQACKSQGKHEHEHAEPIKILGSDTLH
ncbi:YeaC family protein [Atopomonas sediminilitoris]|uniref:YeaC family protein n=1 Tax=Atopomonas sediminilitoris TaxID=2919919 RepID=UPI001F4E3A65|nr:DUF1315 family protein [Atopomonas sediminilitoris]MCJ8168941.1 YeaC family protein [Atopomonas sediminilitoris]